jgi:hypothetical protein
VRTTEPHRLRAGPFLSFRAKGSKTVPLTRERVVRILKQDPYIELVPGA